jgi:hypothetical protein
MGVFIANAEMASRTIYGNFSRVSRCPCKPDENPVTADCFIKFSLHRKACHCHKIVFAFMKKFAVTCCDKKCKLSEAISILYPGSDVSETVGIGICDLEQILEFTTTTQAL